MSKKCIPTSKESIFVKDGLKNSVKKWFSDGKIQAATGGSTREFKDLYWDVTQKDFDYGPLPTRKQIKKFDKAIDKWKSDLTKTPGIFGTYLKLPESILKKFPATKSFFKGIDIASNHYRGNLETFQSEFTGIVRILDDVMKNNTVARRWGLNVKNAQNKLAELEATYKKKFAEGKYEEAEMFYEKNLRDLSKDSELSVFDSFHKLVTDPKVLFSELSRKGPAKYNPAIVEAAQKWHNMSKGLWKEMKRGIDAYADVIKDNSSSYNGMEAISKKIDRLKDIKFEDNYFPTQVLEIFPTLSKLTQDIYSGRANGNSKNLGKYIDTMIENVERNLSVPGAAFERGKMPAMRASKNVPSVLDNYIKNVIRFNYTSRVTKELTGALKKLKDLQGTDLEKQAGYFAKYISDTHNTILGLNIQNSKLGFFARAMTSWQFMSKLGLNVRTVARNATQSLQNYVYFGYKGIKDSMNYEKDSARELMLQKEMKKHGVYFVNLEELSMQGRLLPKVKEVDGRVVEDSAGFADQFGDALEGIAKATGKPMQWVENKVNRAQTFKIAFNLHYNNLLKNDSILRRKIETTKRKEGETTEQHSERIEAQILDEIRKKSSRYAADMVKELHYLYDPWAKPKILQSPVGSVLGQFTTYSINFFEYQRKIAAEGGKDLMAKEWNTPNTQRLARLGMLYGVVNGMLSPLLSVDFSNLVQNDTYERLGQFHSYFAGTEEDREKAFFGKGPLIGTVGGPFISDLIDLGNMVGLMELNEDDGLSYLAGYRDFADRTEDDTVYEVLRLLNQQIARSWKYTAPRWLNGTGPFTLAQQELGLYKTPDIKEKRKMGLKFMNENAPGFIGKWFETAEMKRDKKKKFNQYIKGSNNSMTPNYSEDEMKSLFESLNALEE